ncbi:universal stress protein [Nocardioides sp. GY 10113]|uniref:universal stress protein n=1 Tax=Nocardioides sp. GY 10113 TaxID=2569761 RepID=UPI0010A8F389|nr:universal stress protein [Nocardioides sp. GY 10113]TIC80445.1 universal stress protein [Nocardioides sp. GY 10113]
MDQSPDHSDEQPRAPRVVVGYDGSPDADAALAWAVESAGPLRRPVEVVVVGSAMDPVVGHFREQEDRRVERRRAAALDRLAELGVDGTVTVRRGPTVPELLRASAGAAMLVLGSSGHGLAAGSLTGSVSQHAARHASCPVVTVRPARSTHAHRIVVGLDGSEESAKALRFACERAQSTGESVTAVVGFSSPGPAALGLDDADANRRVRRREDAERTAAAVCADCTSDFPDIDIVIEAIGVRPAKLLVDCSATASLVVVGSRGRDAFTELLLGSVSQHVLQHAECPVAVVR